MNSKIKKVEKKTFLFVFSIIQFYQEMLSVAKYFRKKGNKVVVLFGWKDKQTKVFENSLKNKGIIVRYYPSALLRSSFTLEKENVVSKSKISVFKNLINLYYENKLALNYAENLINEIKPQAIFDGPYWAAQVNYAIGIKSKKHKILYCHLPVFAFMGEMQFGIRFRIIMQPINYSFLSKVLNKITMIFFPSLKKIYENRSYLPHHPLKLFIFWLSGMKLVDPWKIPTKIYDLIFVEANYIRSNLIGEGYHKSKIFNVGKPSLDSVKNNLSNLKILKTYYKNINLDKNENFLLTYFPPYAEHGILSWEEHETLFKKFISTFSNLKTKTMLSLHPACAKNYYLKHYNNLNFLKIIKNGTFNEYLPLASGLVLPISSNTISLSFEFKKKLIIYDFLNKKFEDDLTLNIALKNGAILVNNTSNLKIELYKNFFKTKKFNSINNFEFEKNESCKLIYQTITKRLNQNII